MPFKSWVPSTPFLPGEASPFNRGASRGKGRAVNNGA